MVFHQPKLTHVFWSFSQVSMLTASSILSKQGEEYIHYYCCKKCQALFKTVPELLEHGKNCVGAKILDTGGRLYAYQSSFLKGFVECILTCGHTDNCPLLMRNDITPDDGPATVTNVVAREGLIIVTTADGADRNEDDAGVGKPADTGQAPGEELAFDDNSGADSDVYDPIGDDGDYSDDSMPGKVAQGTPVTRSRLRATEDQESAKASTSQKGLSTRASNKSKENKEHVTLKTVTPQRVPATRSRGRSDASEGQGEKAGTLSTPTTRSKMKANSSEEPPTMIATRSQITAAKANTVQKSPGTRSKSKGVEGHETQITSTPQKTTTTNSQLNVNRNNTGKRRNLTVTPSVSPAKKTPPKSAQSRLGLVTPNATSAQQIPTTAAKVTEKHGNVIIPSSGISVQKTPVGTPTTAALVNQTPTTSSNIKVKIITRRGNKNIVTEAFLRKTTPGETPINIPKPIEEPENEAVKAIMAKKYRPIRPRPQVTTEPQNVAMKLVVVPQPQENITSNPKVNAGQESADTGLNVGVDGESSVKEVSVGQENETSTTTKVCDTTGKEAPEPEENAVQALESEIHAVVDDVLLKLEVTDVRGNVTEFPTDASMESENLHDGSSMESKPTCTGGNKQKSPKGKVDHNVKSQSVSDEAGPDVAKEYTCRWCDYKCDSTIGLGHHMKIHLRKKLWQCVVCGHEAATERKMSVHVEEKHAGCRFKDAAIRIGLKEKEEVPDKDEQSEQLQDTSSLVTEPIQTGSSEICDRGKEDEGDDTVPEYDDIELNYDMTDQPLTESDGEALVEHEDLIRGDHCYGLVPMVDEEPLEQPIQQEPLEEPIQQDPLDETTQLDTAQKHQVRKALPPHKCNHCYYRTWNKLRFLKHVRGHSTVEHQPSVLDKTALKALSNMKDCWYGCPRCHYETGHGGVFRKHMMVHFGIQPWECAICGKRGITRQQIQLHIRWKHKVAIMKDAAVKHDMKFDLNLCDYRIPYATGKEPKPSRGKVGHNVKSQSVSDQAVASVPKEYTCQWCDFKSDSTAGLEHHLMSHVRSNLWQCVVCGHEDATEIKMSAHVEQKHVGCKFEDVAMRIGLQEKEDAPDKYNQEASSTQQPEAVTWGDNLLSLASGGSEVQDGRTVKTMSLQTPQNMQILLEVASEETTTYVPISDPGVNFAIAADSAASFAVAGPSHVPLPEADWQLNTTPSTSKDHVTIEMYGCDLCDFKIGNATRFTQHMLSHQGIKPWQCKICGAGDANKFNIAVHVKAFHRDSIVGKPMKFIDDMSKTVDIDLESYKISVKRRRTKKK